MQELTNKQSEYRKDLSEDTARQKEHVSAVDTRDKYGFGYVYTYQFWKTVFDRLVALLVIIVFSPLLLLIALVICLDSPGNPLFRQERVGKDGSIFTACKFRTMYANNDETEYRNYINRYILENAPYRTENGQGIYKVVDDARVTRFGAILRKTNLDELPQFINVLKGEMSIIGPRPEVGFAVRMYNEQHQKRLAVKPGITGLWQVSGRKNCSFEEMVKLDIEYIDKQSLLLDAKILWQTAGIIIKRDGS